MSVVNLRDHGKIMEVRSCALINRGCNWVVWEFMGKNVRKVPPSCSFRSGKPKQVFKFWWAVTGIGKRSSILQSYGTALALAQRCMS